jgi:hypothetical protein
MATLSKGAQITVRKPSYCSSHRKISVLHAIKAYKTLNKKTRKESLMCCASATVIKERDDVYQWMGVDDFSQLDDRIDAPPLPLPPIKEAKRIVLVRHGQSTWNAEGRIQGSSDMSVLTEKGQAQAQTTQQMVGSEDF